MPRPTGKRGTFTFRTTPALRERLQAAAAQAERPVSEEIEARLALSLEPPVATLEDVRQILREEIRAALAERQPSFWELHTVRPAAGAVPDIDIESAREALDAWAEKNGLRRSEKPSSEGDGRAQ